MKIKKIDLKSERHVCNRAHKKSNTDRQIETIAFLESLGLNTYSTAPLLRDKRVLEAKTNTFSFHIHLGVGESEP